MFHSRASLYHGITVCISIHHALLICDLFVWMLYSFCSATVHYNRRCWTLVSLHLDIFQVIGGQLRCLMGKWWNNCTQYHNHQYHQYHPVPPCIALCCIVMPIRCIVLNCIANLYHNIEMCHRFVLHYSIASFSISYCIVSLFLVALFCISFNLSFKYPSYQKSACKTWVNTLEVILRHSCWDIWAYQLRKSLMILWQCLL